MSITDGSYMCGRCGDWRTVCGLCVGEMPGMVIGPTHNVSDDNELIEQTRSIRRAADKRQGW
jgi:hypothetical protein